MKGNDLPHDAEVQILKNCISASCGKRIWEANLYLVRMKDGTKFD